MYRWQETTNRTGGRRQQTVQVARDNKLYSWQKSTTESNCIGDRRNNCTGGRKQQLYRWQETTTVLVAGDNTCVGGSTSIERGIYPPVFSSTHDVASLVQPNTPGIRR